jgi:ribose transport system permease protein
MHDERRRFSLRALRTSHPWLGPCAALVVVYGLFAVLRAETFASADTLVVMTERSVVVSLAAVGMTLIIILGGIDLSVGSQVALTTVVIASMLKSGAGALAAATGGIGAAAAVGLANGTLVTRLRVAPFIVTLGTMSLVRGLGKGLAKEQKIDVDPHGLESFLTALPAAKSWMIFPSGVWIAVVVAMLAGALLRLTRLGRHVFAIGSNEQTARLCGIAVSRVKVTVYALAGALTGLAGLMEFSRLTVGDPTDSIGLELQAIAAVVIGGGSLSGGEGSIAGTLVGAFLMTVINEGSMHMGLPNWVEEIATGLIIVVAVSLDPSRRRRAA